MRFPSRFEGLKVPVYYLRVEIGILEGQASWDRLVERICVPSAPPKLEHFYD